MFKAVASRTLDVNYVSKVSFLFGRENKLIHLVAKLSTPRIDLLLNQTPHSEKLNIIHALVKYGSFDISKYGSTGLLVGITALASICFFRCVFDLS